MRDVLVIDMNERWATCWACGIDTPCHWGLPIGAYAELVSNDYEGEWGGVPACRECYEGHAQGLLTADTLEQWKRRRQLERRAYEAAFARE